MSPRDSGKSAFSYIMVSTSRLMSSASLSARANASAKAADESIADAYYEAFSPSDIPGEWELILQDDEEENS